MINSKIIRHLLTGAAICAAANAASASDNFSGVTIEAKLIGGAQYENLYARIGDWEAATGAKVSIISKKSHFEIDKEIKSDMAAGTTSWCIGSNHSSFSPQYEGLYADLNKYVNKDDTAGFVPSVLNASKVGGELLMLPRAQFDVSALYYLKSNYTDDAKNAEFKEKYGYDLAPPKTWTEVKDQSIFFSDPPNFYGTQYAGKDEALVGRFYEMLVAEGGVFLDENNKPKFNSKAGQRALQWFVDLYEAKAVPMGVTNYVWDDLGQGFASGSIALNLDWPGWAGFFNDPKASKAAGNVGVVVQPMGSVTRTGWSGHHGFSVTNGCENKDAAVSLVKFLTSEESQLIESAGGSLPTRTSVWATNVAAAKSGDDPFRAEVLATFSEASKFAFAVPSIAEWGELVNILFPELQAAIVGDKSAKEALNTAAKKSEETLAENGYY